MSFENKVGIAFVIFTFLALLWSVDFGAHRNEYGRSHGSYLEEACMSCNEW